MGNADAILALVDALKWPVTILLVVLILKKPKRR